MLSSPCSIDHVQQTDTHTQTGNNMTHATVRPLHAIARDIRATWPNVNFAAAPYLSAMSSLDSIDDTYGMDSARSIVLYFLSNASTWRGDDARRIKAELKALSKRR